MADPTTTLPPDGGGSGDAATTSAVERAERRFPELVPPTKIVYVDGKPATLRLRVCRLTVTSGGRPRDHEFEGSVVRIGAMPDNDLVLHDETVSRYHCKIVQTDQSYLLVDLGSTNGTFINRVRIREAFLKPDAVVHIGRTELRFHAGDERVEIVPSKKERLGELLGRHARMREIYAILEKIGPAQTTVIIEGETGTGKEVVAKTLHKLSPRARGPFVVFDCGAVPANLLESELFGHEKGSFTGAIMARQGLFEQAHGGTLFLDELGELALEMQPKLLRALEQREIRRVGSSHSFKVDVRVIAATNRNLEEEVRAGRFRQDLFYRLSVVRLFLPPLRERSEDVGLLAQHFLDTLPANQVDDGRQRVRQVSPEALARLAGYRWPGNVRELHNVIERAVSFADGDTLLPEQLPESVNGRQAAPPPPPSAHAGRGATPVVPERRAPNTPPPLEVEVDDAQWRHDERDASAEEPDDATMPGAPAGRPPAGAASTQPSTFKDAKERWIARFERDYVARMLQRNGGNISHAAREADIDRKYFRKLMRKYGIGSGDSADDDEPDV